jgi:uncharacterized protein YdhG (YjbR/CyaY superfamily)
MDISKNQPADIDEFIAAYPPDMQEILQKIRATIRDAAPEATEKIAYGIPTFTLHGNLVHFSTYPGHIGFYPGSAPVTEFARELEPYETSKGTIRFPLDWPVPYDLIDRIVRYCVIRNESKRKKK